MSQFANLTFGQGTPTVDSVVLGGLTEYLASDDTPAEIEAKYVQFRVGALLALLPIVDSTARMLANAAQSAATNALTMLANHVSAFNNHKNNLADDGSQLPSDARIHWSESGIISVIVGSTFIRDLGPYAQLSQAGRTSVQRGDMVAHTHGNIQNQLWLCWSPALANAPRGPGTLNSGWRPISGAVHTGITAARHYENGDVARVGDDGYFITSPGTHTVADITDPNSTVAIALGADSTRLLPAASGGAVGQIAKIVANANPLLPNVWAIGDDEQSPGGSGTHVVANPAGVGGARIGRITVGSENFRMVRGSSILPTVGGAYSQPDARITVATANGYRPEIGDAVLVHTPAMLSADLNDLSLRVTYTEGGAGNATWPLLNFDESPVNASELELGGFFEAFLLALDPNDFSALSWVVIEPTDLTQAEVEDAMGARFGLVSGQRLAQAIAAHGMAGTDDYDDLTNKPIIRGTVAGTPATDANADALLLDTDVKRLYRNVLHQSGSADATWSDMTTAALRAAVGVGGATLVYAGTVSTHQALPQVNAHDDCYYIRDTDSWTRYATNVFEPLIVPKSVRGHFVTEAQADHELGVLVGSGDGNGYLAAFDLQGVSRAQALPRVSSAYVAPTASVREWIDTQSGVVGAIVAVDNRAQSIQTQVNDLADTRIEVIQDTVAGMMRPVENWTYDDAAGTLTASFAGGGPSLVAWVAGTYAAGRIVSRADIIWIATAETTDTPLFAAGNDWRAIGNTSDYVGLHVTNQYYRTGQMVRDASGDVFLKTGASSSANLTHSSWTQLTGGVAAPVESWAQPGGGRVPEDRSYAQTIDAISYGNISDNRMRIAYNRVSSTANTYFNLPFWLGTEAQYEALTAYDDNVVYFTY